MGIRNVAPASKGHPGGDVSLTHPQSQNRHDIEGRTPKPSRPGLQRITLSLLLLFSLSIG